MALITHPSINIASSMMNGARLLSICDGLLQIIHVILSSTLNNMAKLRQDYNLGIHKSKKNRQHNGQKKKYKRINNDLQNIHIKLNIE
jgi:hypothetical protein